MQDEVAVSRGLKFSGLIWIFSWSKNCQIKISMANEISFNADKFGAFFGICFLGSPYNPHK